IWEGFSRPPCSPWRTSSGARKPVLTSWRTWWRTVPGSRPSRSASCLLVSDWSTASRRMRSRRGGAGPLASSGVAGRRFMETILSIDYSKSMGYCPSMKLGRNFHRALVASGFANLADGVFQVALPLLAVQLTRSPLLIAGVQVAARLPWLLAPVAGALADRLDRRQTMVRVNLVRTVLLGGLALAVAADLATLVMLYAVALLLGIGETLFDTSAQSLLPAVVDRDELTRANSRLFAVELVANTFIGPPLGRLVGPGGLAV